METIKEDELEEVDISYEESVKEADLLGVEMLSKESEDFINFDFDFENV